MLRLLHVIAGSVVVAVAASAREFRFGGQTLTAAEGFLVELVAATPLAERPISVDFDETGRIYVTDSSGSNEAVKKQLVDKAASRDADADGEGAVTPQGYDQMLSRQELADLIAFLKAAR